MSVSLQKNKSVAFLGFGELANQFMIFLDLSKSDIVIFDDNVKDKNVFHFSEFKNHINKHHWLVALGYNHLKNKLQLIQQILLDGGELLSFTHSTAFVSETARLRAGVFIYPMCNVDKGVQIGEGTLLNNSVVVSHNTIIGKATYLSPGVIISGNVEIGNACFLGSGTIVSNGICIGDNVIIGAGSVITKNIPSNSFVIGNPMVFKNNIQLI